MTDAELDAINPGWREGIYKPLKTTGPTMTEEERERDGDEMIAGLIEVQYEGGQVEMARDNAASLVATVSGQPWGGAILARVASVQRAHVDTELADAIEAPQIAQRRQAKLAGLLERAAARKEHSAPPPAPPKRPFGE